MKIEIVVDPSKPSPAASLVSRVAPSPAVAPAVESVPRFAHLDLAVFVLASDNSSSGVVPGLVVVVAVVARSTSVLRRLRQILMLRWK